MNQKFLLCLLLPITVVSAMEHASNEILVYNISPRLNRLEKNAFRATNKKHYKLICYQSLLNENYAFACASDNEDAILEWRKKGALHLHEEVYNLFSGNKKCLTVATRLCYPAHRPIGGFCIQSAFTQGITLNNKPFILFLLKEKKPIYSSNLIVSAIAHSEKLGRGEIIETLEQYIAEEKLPKHTPSYFRGGGGGGPPRY